MSFFVQQTVNGLALGSVFALYALGFSLVFANLKAFHVAHASVFTWAAVFTWYLTERLGWPLAIAVPSVVVLAGLLNVATYFVGIRHLENRKHRDLAVFVSSLAVGILLTELALRYLHHGTVRMPFKLVSSHTWRFGVLRVSSIQVLMLTLASVAFIVLRWLLGSTEFGRETQAVAHDREVAAMLGISVNRINALVFFLSGALAGVGASLVAVAFNVIDADLGSTYLVMAMAILVIGGLGSVTGGFIGGLLVGVASAYTTGYVTSSYRDVVVFGLLLAVLLVRPSGLFKSVDILGRA